MPSILAISPAAIAEVLELRAGEWAAEHVALRVAVITRRWAESEFRFVPLDVIQPDDMVERHGELGIAMSPRSADVLQDAELKVETDALTVEYDAPGDYAPTDGALKRQRTLSLSCRLARASCSSRLASS